MSAPRATETPGTETVATPPIPTVFRSPAKSVIVGSVAILCLIWSSTWLVIQEGLKDLPPFSSAAMRFCIAAIVMSGASALLARREGGERAPFRFALLLGLSNFAGSYGIVYWSETRLPSGLVSTLWSTFPVAMALIAWVMLPQERLKWRQWLGFLVALVGVALLFATDLQKLGPDAVTAGSVLLLSPIISAVGTLAIKRWANNYSSLRLNRDAMLVGAAALSAVAWIAESPADVELTTRGILSILYLAIFGTVITFGLYFWVMRYASAVMMSQIAYVTPAMAILLGAVLGDEPVYLHTFGGLALILLGVAFVARGQRSKSRSQGSTARRD